MTGSAKPYVEFPVDRVVNVHWKQHDEPPPDPHYQCGEYIHQQITPPDTPVQAAGYVAVSIDGTWASSIAAINLFPGSVDIPNAAIISADWRTDDHGQTIGGFRVDINDQVLSWKITSTVHAWMVPVFQYGGCATRWDVSVESQTDIQYGIAFRDYQGYPYTPPPAPDFVSEIGNLHGQGDTADFHINVTYNKMTVDPFGQPKLQDATLWQYSKLLLRHNCLAGTIDPVIPLCPCGAVTYRAFADRYFSIVATCKHSAVTAASHQPVSTQVIGAPDPMRLTPLPDPFSQPLIGR